MESARPKANISGHAKRGQDIESLIDYCSRPLCRKEFRRTIGPGRRQEYCSDLCRRSAEKEFRQTRARLVHFEGVAEILRADLAAFGKTDFDEVDSRGQPSAEDRRNAEDAVRRAAGALTFANPDEPAVRELQMLYEAVVPIILP